MFFCGSLWFLAVLFVGSWRIFFMIFGGSLMFFVVLGNKFGFLIIIGYSFFFLFFLMTLGGSGLLAVLVCGFVFLVGFW